MYQRAAPYAQRVLDMGDLLPHQPTVDALGNEPAVQRDLLTELLFRLAIKDQLTTYPIDHYKVDLKECHVEISDGSVRSPDEAEKAQSQEKTSSLEGVGSPEATSSLVDEGVDDSPADGLVLSAGSDSSE